VNVVADPREARRLRRELAGSVGLVPTMGALHDGHLSLVRRARSECASVAASIFVNPAQFGPNEDLAKYPRNLEADLSKLEAEGVALVFAPEPSTVYPALFDTWVVPGRLAERLEGGVRPGHFRGVATVVTKLFNLLEPDRAYFGQKDAQQAIIVRRLVADFDLDLEIVVCPIVRERDGLAMSSRNVYLTPEERAAAPVIHRALRAATALFGEGERRGAALRASVERVLSAQPLAVIDYVSAADPETLEEVEIARERVLVSTAVRFGATRLIDNILLPEGMGL
jgi:pantoate--beta-alanine ligase